MQYADDWSWNFIFFENCKTNFTIKWSVPFYGGKCSQIQFRKSKFPNLLYAMNNQSCSDTFLSVIRMNVNLCKNGKAIYYLQENVANW